jgi:hypothetical protein
MTRLAREVAIERQNLSGVAPKVPSPSSDGAQAFIVIVHY